MKVQTLLRQQGEAVARSAGVVLGCVQKLNQQHQFIREYHIEVLCVNEEVSRLKEAVFQASQALKKEVEQLSAHDETGDLTPILEAHHMMLQDPELFSKTVSFIRNDGINAEWALKKALTEITLIFDRIQDPYLRSRKADVEHVGQRIFDSLMGEDSALQYDASIMVAQDFSPADVVAMWRAGVPGFISIQGGENSHAMIVARGVGLPGIAGVQGLFELIDDGSQLILDAEQGLWILHPDMGDIQQFESAQKQLNAQEKALQHYVDQTSTSADGYEMPLLANIEFIEEVGAANQHGADGIGLFRTEFLFMQGNHFPDESTQFAYYEQVVKGMKGKPVTFRLLDVAADKLNPNSDVPFVFEGENPALGLRGVRMLLNNVEVLKAQLRAVVRTSVFAKISILVPMVTLPAEMIEVRCILDDICAELDWDGHVDLGCMIEVPAAVFVADELAKVSDFFSIGSNDLLQYSLAVDRTDEHVSYLYDVNHPAVVQLIQMAVNAARAHGIPISVCGELAANTAWLHSFLTMKITSLSMSARHILPMRKALQQMRAHS